jgi:hypothetical protein
VCNIRSASRSWQTMKSEYKYGILSRSNDSLLFQVIQERRQLHKAFSSLELTEEDVYIGMKKISKIIFLDFVHRLYFNKITFRKLDLGPPG